MRNLVIASIAALAALVVTSNMAANAINARAAHEGWGGLTRMAQETPAPEMWFIKGVVTINGKSEDTRFVVPDTDNENNGQPLVLTFDSKESCETAMHDDPDIAKPLAIFQLVVAKRGGTVVITCEKFVHPPIKPPGTEI